MNKLKAIISILLIIILCFSVAACGSKNSGNMSADGKVMLGEVDYDEGLYSDELADNADKPNDYASYGGTEDRSGMRKANLKLIYRADVYLQTLDFDKSLGDIEKLVSDVEGYFENRQIDNGSYYRRANYKTANFIIRVPSDKYQDFLSSVSGSCHVVSISQNIEDIGDAYYDTESRIKTLQIKEERLQSLLSKATKMSDIIQLESALSENEYSLNMYKNQLRDYDSLVDYSTIEISLESVDTLSDDVTTELSFGQRLTRAIKNGASDFASGLGDFAIWFGYNILKIVLVLIIAALLIRFRPVSRFFNFLKGKRSDRKSQKKLAKSETSATENSEDKK